MNGDVARAVAGNVQHADRAPAEVELLAADQPRSTGTRSATAEV